MVYNDYKGMNLSRLGFGCMRFPYGPDGNIDQELVNEMFKVAISRGVNYFDTAYPYLNGCSELAMAEALKDYPRESYYLADKFPGHSLPGPVDNVALFNVSLKKCRTDYFDFYLLHNITEWSIKIYEDPAYHIIPDMLKLRKEGKIHHLGFSFHGGNELLEDILTRYEGVFEFVQIQCNYLDWTLQKAKEKVDIIKRHGLDIWIMEPLRGGKLAALEPTASNKLQALKEGASDASFALRFLMDIPEVKVILSGMNAMEQVNDNIDTFEKDERLSKEERKTLLEIAEGMKNGVPCTACRYCCKGCPVGLDIPMLIECYNTNKMGANITSSMRIDGLTEDKRPAACISCGQCSHACPQGIDVPEVMAELARMYDTDPKWAEMSKGRVESVKRDLNL